MLEKYRPNCMEKKPSTDSESMNSKYDIKFTEITEKFDKIFVLTMMTYHCDNLLLPKTILEQLENPKHHFEQDLKVMLGCAAFKSAEFYLKFSANTPPVLFSVKKCMIGITDSYKNEL